MDRSEKIASLDIGLPMPLPVNPEEYDAWATRVMEHRYRVLWETSRPGEPGALARAREVVRCKRSFLYEANTYGGIFEARAPAEEWSGEGEGEWFAPTEGQEVSTDYPTGVNIPYIMYPFQLEVSVWMDERMSSKGSQADGVVVKARDMGLSNEVAFYAAHHWLWTRNFQCRMLSRKEDLVDRIGDPDSLFWKIESYLMGLPDWLFRSAVGDEFDWKRDRTLMRFINPKNRNLISGESTQANAGRGGRATMVVLDEAAFMDDLERIWTALRASTNHRFAVSTVSIDHGLGFYNLEQGKNQEKPAVLRIPWDQHPKHDAAWLASEVARDSEQGVKREILMDYFAGQGEYVYPETHDFVTGNYPYEPMGGPVYCAIDDGFDDYWAMLIMQYNPRTGRVRVLDAYANNHKPVDFYGSLIRNQYRDDFAKSGWYGDREKRFTELIQQLPPMVFVGDTHGEQVEQIAGMSVFQHLAEKWGIVVNVDYTKRKHTQRRHFTGLILPLTDFNNTDGAEYVLESFKRHRFKKTREGRDQTTEYREPLHSEASHPVTAFEYFATQLDIFRLTAIESSSRISWTGARNRSTGA